MLSGTPNRKPKMVRSLYIIALLVLCFVSITPATPTHASPPAAPVNASTPPKLTSLNIWRDGSNIHGTYCGTADAHDLTIAEKGANAWEYTYNYGALNPGYCWNAYFFSGVVDGDRLWVRFWLHRPGYDYTWVIVDLYPTGSTGMSCRLLMENSQHPRTSSFTKTSNGCNIKW